MKLLTEAEAQVDDLLVVGLGSGTIDLAPKDESSMLPENVVISSRSDMIKSWSKAPGVSGGEPTVREAASHDHYELHFAAGESSAFALLITAGGALIIESTVL